MNSHEPAARLDVTLEHGLLVRIKDVAGGVEENDGLVIRQVCVGEHCGILGSIHSEIIVRPQHADGLDAVGDRVVAEAGRLGKNQDTKIMSLDRRGTKYTAG